MKVYQHDDQPGDPRQPHHSGVDLPASHLTALGVQYHPSSHTSPSIVDDLASAKAFSHRDEITYSPAAMGAAYEDQVAMNFHEHIHDEDEIRYITQGSGYFDVRDADDSKWARIKVDRGDCIVLPRGIYHRFMVDENNDITMIRLFKDANHITQENRSAETERIEARKLYVDSLAEKSLKA